MGKGLAILAFAAAMGGCSDTQNWFAQWQKPGRPVSVPTAAEPALPASHPAEAATAPATVTNPLAAGDAASGMVVPRIRGAGSANAATGPASRPARTVPATVASAAGTAAIKPATTRPASGGTVAVTPTSPGPSSMPAAERPGTVAVTTPRPGGETGKPVNIAPSPTAKVEPPSPKPAPTGTAAPKPPLPPVAAGGPVMAYVNDMPVYMSELNRLLVAAFGMGVAQQLIANQLVDEEGRKQGLSVTDAETQAEHERTLTEMFGDVKDADQRQRLLQQLLARNRVSEEQWDLTMHRNTLLAKLAAKKVTVTEEDLQEEFGRTYERKVEVMHIQVASLSDAQKVLRELANGAEFGALVAKYSIGPSGKEGGLLAPFGAKDAGTPPALREAGLALKKIGEVSDPIQVGTAFHLIKLMKIIEPKNVKFEDVKTALTETVRRRKTAMLQQDILQILIRGARILYVNPTLKAQAEKGS